MVTLYAGPDSFRDILDYQQLNSNNNFMFWKCDLTFMKEASNLTTYTCRVRLNAALEINNS